MAEEDVLSFQQISNQIITIKRKDWMEGKTLDRVTDLAMLKRVVDECLAVPAYGYDTETTGLDRRVIDGRTVDKIVGYCLAPNVNTGYYVPVRHKEGEEYNLPVSEVNKEMIRLAEGKSVAVFHNAGFDHEMLEYGEDVPLGKWDSASSFEDTMYLAYLQDSRRKRKGLKYVTMEELGWEMIELEELYPPDQPKYKLDFSLLDPSDDGPVLYGCSDAICTLALYEKLIVIINNSDIKGVASQKTIYTIEKMTIAATRWMERSRLPLDLDKVVELIKIGQDDLVKAFSDLYDAVNNALEREPDIQETVDVCPAWVKMLRSVYPGIRETVRIDKAYIDELRQKAKALPLEERDPLDGKDAKKFKKKKKGVGDVEYQYKYDVMSPKQLGLMLDELGINMPKTETGQITTAKEELDKVIEKHGEKFEYMNCVKQFREVNKVLGSFLFPMENDSHTDGSILVQFKQHGTDTGRFSTPGEKDRGGGLHGGTSINLHSFPSKDKKDKVESMRRIRECVAARPGKIICAIDYSGVELRIVTAVSGEPKWIQAFYECSSCGKKYSNQVVNGLPAKTPAYCYKCGDDRIGDLHTISGIAFYGADAPDKDDWLEKRGYAKNTNFALLFGGTGNTVSARVGCDKPEGWRIYRQFNSTYTTLQKWQKKQVAFAKKHGFVFTALGRRYPCPDIANPLKWIREKNERNAINGPIQGTSADITKLAMALCYKLCRDKGWLDKVHLLITIHDELVFEIDEDLFEEAVIELENVMTTNKVIAGLKWPIPLTTDVEFGKNWAVPYDRKDWVFQREDQLYGYHDDRKDKDVPGWEQWAIDLFSAKSVDPNVQFKGDASQKSLTASNSKPLVAQSPSSGPVVDPIVPEDMKMGDIFIHKIRGPITLDYLLNLAEVISDSHGCGGTRRLRVETQTGKVLVNEDDGINVRLDTWSALVRLKLKKAI